VCPAFDVAQLADHPIGTVTFLGAVAFAGATIEAVRTSACSMGSSP